MGDVKYYVTDFPIDDKKNHYLALPGLNEGVLDITITFSDGDEIAQAIQCKGIDLAETVDDHDDNFSQPLRTFSRDRLLGQIADHFAVPSWQLSIAPAFHGEKDFSSLQLCSWGPQEELLFR